MSNTIIEMVSYRLQEGVNKKLLEATHDKVNAFLHTQDGFLYRSISEDKDGLLFDVVYWQDMETAKAAGEAFMKDEAGQALVSLTDENSINMRHMPVLSETCSSTVAA